MVADADVAAAAASVPEADVEDDVAVAAGDVAGERDPTAAQAEQPELEDAEVEAEGAVAAAADRSEEHTSELQSLAYLVCRLLLEQNRKTPVAIWRRQVEKTKQHPPAKAYAD